MKLKISSVIKWIIIALILMHLCFAKFFFPNSYMFGSVSNYFASAVYVSLVVISVIIVSFVKTKISNKYIRIELLLIGIICIYSLFTLSMSKIEIIQQLHFMRPFLYMFLTIPLYYLLARNRWNYRTFVCMLVLLITIDTLIRIYISTAGLGESVYRNIALEGAGESWYRNNIQRINPNCLFYFAIPGACYLIYTSKTLKEKIFWIACIVTCYYHIVAIWQARSALIYCSVVLMLMFILKKEKTNKNLLRIIIVLSIIAIFLSSDSFANFMATFSTSNAQYGASTSIRLVAMSEYFARLVSSPIFGLGILTNSGYVLSSVGNLSDCGFLYSLVQGGLIILAFYIIIFYRAFHIYKCIKKDMPYEALFVLGLTLLVIICGINIDPFSMFSFSIPFYIVAYESLFVRWNNDFKSPLSERK